jgi:hypothetical protein
MLEVLSVPSPFIPMFASFSLHVSRVLKWIAYLLNYFAWKSVSFFLEVGDGGFKTTKVLFG